MERKININEKGNFVHGGCDTVELAKEYGTPLYVFDEQDIRKRCRRIQKCFMERYPAAQALFASKAFCSIPMYNILKEEGMGLDVVSGGELYTALKAEFPMENVYFHGNNKTEEEIILGIENNAGCFIIDNEPEMDCIQKLAQERGKIVKALLRITPGVSGVTHQYMSTGQVDSKFGFQMHGGSALDAVKRILKCPNIHFAGLHCHIGSHIFEPEPYSKAVHAMTQFMQDIKIKLGVEIEELNMGGGFGAYDADTGQLTDIEYYIGNIMEAISERCGVLGLKLPRILVEPGRWIVAESGITLYKVGSVKKIDGVRTYVSVDGGMADNPRYALYQAAYQAVAATKMNEPLGETVTIAGRCCESGDLLIENIRLPELQAGDILAVLGTGAYNYSMSSNYNRLRKPAVAIVNEGTSRLAIRRESYEDLIRNEI